MLPLVIDEQKIFPFKFWFEGNIQDGMYYNKELFCRLQVFDVRYRAQVYRFGVQICQQPETLVAIALSKETCSLWVSLRSPLVKTVLVEGVPLSIPNLEEAPKIDRSPSED
ncbi:MULTISPECIES: hypothetical protein [Desertifilum]|uniref:Uncharacterized protein n=2 Tax=Desertifilum tharense IPPAS B-1220 TaxID=1781255 RepID=A0A1E5QGC8_9CYAN|nr:MULTISPECIES: hypothetical protein [Desertifilum]MBD2334576.1 hypothetical protein [Desertifilum sp. FACHB-868]OEJ73651.1 hypothetical protein BH720_18530 [Desertifilum tharense IPPAS B-1220]